MPTLDYDPETKKVTVSGVPAFDDVYDPKVQQLIDVVGMDDIGPELKKFYFKIETRYDICPENGCKEGKFQPYDLTGYGGPIPGVETGFCIDCKMRLLRVNGRVYTYPFGHTGKKYIWRYKPNANRA